MSFWSVELEFENVPRSPVLEDRVDDLLEDLVGYSAAVGYNQDSLSVRLAIEKIAPERVVEEALAPVMRARAVRGLGTSPPVRIEMESVEGPESCWTIA